LTVRRPYVLLLQVVPLYDGLTIDIRSGFPFLRKLAGLSSAWIADRTRRKTAEAIRRAEATGLPPTQVNIRTQSFVSASPTTGGGHRPVRALPPRRLSQVLAINRRVPSEFIIAAPSNKGRPLSCECRHQHVVANRWPAMAPTVILASSHPPRLCALSPPAPTRKRRIL